MLFRDTVLLNVYTFFCLIFATRIFKFACLQKHFSCFAFYFIIHSILSPAQHTKHTIKTYKFQQFDAAPAKWTWLTYGAHITVFLELTEPLEYVRMYVCMQSKGCELRWHLLRMRTDCESLVEICGLTRTQDFTIQIRDTLKENGPFLPLHAATQKSTFSLN